MASAVRAKLESFKKPTQAKAMSGKVNTKDEFAPKNTPPHKLDMSLIRMAMANQRRGQAQHDKEVSADALGTVRSGTMDRDSQMLQQIDGTIAGIDELLKSLGAQ